MKLKHPLSIQSLEQERDAAITRAEAAEAEVAALREREADLVHTLHMEQDAHDRCREELAAREWPPVTGPPATSHDVEFRAVGFYSHDRWYMKYTPTAWRPRPAPEDADR